jgi:hypothetical protein
MDPDASIFNGDPRSLICGEFGEARPGQLLWKKTIFPVVEAVGGDLVLAAPSIDRLTAFPLLADSFFPCEPFFRRKGF